MTDPTSDGVYPEPTSVYEVVAPSRQAPSRRRSYRPRKKQPVTAEPTKSTSGPVSQALRFQVLRRDNHTCSYCGGKPPGVELVVEHVVPRTLGGLTEPENLTTACKPCNLGKSATPPDAATVAQVRADTVR